MDKSVGWFWVSRRRLRMLALFRMEKMDPTGARQRDKHVNPDRRKCYMVSGSISLILDGVALDSFGLKGGKGGRITIDAIWFTTY
jgi:hypothetical protein